ncbi:MAG: DUF4367 domain-containing protein [Firmicutes bacterium]|nr:DUF4367 domain-containing protein [Bacillota bacterium]
MIRKKKDFTKYEKQFSDLLIKSVQQHTENAEPPQIDYSFLNEDEPVRLNIVRKRAVPKALARVSVILIVFFVGISVALVTDMPGTASAWKAQMARRLYVLKEGFVSSDPNVLDNYANENTTTIVINDLAKIEKVQKIAPELPIPEYVPEGYKFDTLTFDSTYDGVYNAIYKFIGKNNNEFSLIIQHDSNVDYSTTIVDYVVQTIYLDDKIIYEWQNSIEESYGVIVACQDYMVNIIGTINNEEMLSVAKNLN